VVLESAPPPWEVAYHARRAAGAALILHGDDDGRTSWPVRLAALRADPLDLGEGPASVLLDALEREVSRRRRRGAPAGTGLGVALGFDLFQGDASSGSLLAVDVPVAIRYGDAGGAPTLVARDPGGLRWGRNELRAIAALPPVTLPDGVAAATTSLPRDRYVRAVKRILAHIREGDVYQVNLCQRFETDFAGDPLEAFRRVEHRSPAPRSAYLEVGRRAIVSASPEVFVDGDPDGRVRTLPIKGTRPRGRAADDDAALRRDLETSSKDRAELTMIVDLERNDLGRVCRWGSIEVTTPGEVRTFPEVHHLVAEVTGVLDPQVGIRRLVEAVFPGGSISGAPKTRAMQILREIEPCRRDFFTGSFLWLGDDGSVASSILIRTAEVAGGVVRIGAGGGIVADSVPEVEWRESCHKARALARCFGFEPEEAR
jgi:anthranilate/para-aminobenzoate synthase component I